MSGVAGIRAFYKYARDRHQIYLNRMAGKPRPWTKDPILQTYRFTNVFRELDKTTVWYRENVRERYDGTDLVMLATVVFRMFNRIEVGETVFNQYTLPRGSTHKTTAFELFAKSGDVSHLKHAIVTALPRGPHATGAYIISSPPGYSKLDGILEVIWRFYKTKHVIDESWVTTPVDWKTVTNILSQTDRFMNLEQTYEWLTQFDYFGKFHSYEIVTDLRHTKLLGGAGDIMKWANPGPGARRGANRVMGRVYNDKSVRRNDLIQEMRDILAYSRKSRYWPQNSLAHPKWEMRDVEHTLCEFDKYERVRNGQGRPRGVYR